ncbi:hypothetical protein [Nocardia sp. NBC_00511]|uniref:hypothetical protein n=1 Tax=Nocardia sp. NBC_00511 TaxID=2903591 RepID=UPI0030E0D80D
MRYTRIALTTLAVLSAVTLTACTDSSGSSAAAKPSTTPTPAVPAPANAFPAAGHEAVQCGTGPWGLAVVASTAKGNDFCPVAHAVVDAYAADRAQQSNGDIAVTVGTVRWVCGQRQGDPNPYQECASQNESADLVRLHS